MKISIITVAYNSELTIRDTIESVLTQSYSEIEYIIVDGFSSDNTLPIIKEYQSQFNGRMHWISEKDDGIYDAMNKGIHKATGDIIGFLNSDDTFYNSEVLNKITSVFQTDPEIACVWGNLVFVNENKKIVRKWQSKTFQPGLFEKSWSPAHITFYCRREVYEIYGMYKTDYKIAADVELMLRFLELNLVKSFFINEILVTMLIGGVSTQGLKSTITITKELKRAFKENGLSFNLPRYLFYKALKIKEYLN